MMDLNRARKAFIMALFANHEGFLSEDYLDEKLEHAFRSRNLNDLRAPLDGTNTKRFEYYLFREETNT